MSRLLSVHTLLLLVLTLSSTEALRLRTLIPATHASGPRHTHVYAHTYNAHVNGAHAYTYAYTNAYGTPTRGRGTALLAVEASDVGVGMGEVGVSTVRTFEATASPELLMGMLGCALLLSASAYVWWSQVFVHYPPPRSCTIIRTKPSPPTL
jgi:hypothetical protein